MAWRLAKSLTKLREQINAAFPTRDKTSDGSIGDTSHSARKSDHNPNKAGVVCAIDIDEDLNSDDFELQDIVGAICKSRDPRVKYIIYESKITVAGSELQRWKKYTGKNAHSHHAHISVESDPKLYDSVRPWKLGLSDSIDAGDGAKVIEGPKPLLSETPAPAPAPATLPTVDPTGPAPASFVAIPTPVVEVESVSAAPTDAAPKEDALTKIGNKAVAFWGTVGTTLIAIGTWLTSTPQGIATAIVVAAASAAVVYMIINALRQNAKDKRDAEIKKRDDEIKLDRERRAHELQKLTLESAMRPDLNAVRIVSPPTTEMPNSDTAEAAKND